MGVYELSRPDTCMICKYMQGRRKLPEGGAAADIDIKACKDGNSARSAGKNFLLRYQDGFSWHFRTLKTRKRRFQTI